MDLSKIPLSKVPINEGGRRFLAEAKANMAKKKKDFHSNNEYMVRDHLDFANRKPNSSVVGGQVAPVPGGKYTGIWWNCQPENRVKGTAHECFGYDPSPRRGQGSDKCSCKCHKKMFKNLGVL